VSKVKIDNPQTRKFLEAHNKLYTKNRVELDFGHDPLASEPETFTSPPETLPEPLKPSRPIQPHYLPPEFDLETAQRFAERALRPVKDTLSKAHYRVLLALVTVALAIWRLNNYSQHLSVVTFFMPAELIYNYFGIPKRTWYHALERLEAMNLVASTGHHCKAPRWIPECESWTDGTLFAVKVDPFSEQRPRIGHDWMKKQYRNLPSDIKANRTVWALLQRVKQSLHSQKQGLKALLKFDEFLAWSGIPPHTTQNQENMTVQNARELFDRLESLGSKERPTINSEVWEIASAMAHFLRDGDKHKPDFYLRILWNALRMDKRMIPDALIAITNALKRVFHDTSDWSKLKNPPGVFVTRLKELGWLDEILREPPTRIGVTP
jgi:hypothetical protein